MRCGAVRGAEPEYATPQSSLLPSHTLTTATTAYASAVCRPFLHEAGTLHMPSAASRQSRQPFAGLLSASSNATGTPNARAASCHVEANYSATTRASLRLRQQLQVLLQISASLCITACLGRCRQPKSPKACVADSCMICAYYAIECERTRHTGMIRLCRCLLPMLFIHAFL